MRQLYFVLFLIFSFNVTHGQYSYIIVPNGQDVVAIGQAVTPEHGFLPGKQFKFYPTINKYDFSGQRMRVELYDQRDSLKLVNLPCAKVEINNNSEFAGPNGALKVGEYFQHLFSESNMVPDTSASDTLKVFLQALDARLIGFGSITAHGLCQMQMVFKNISKTYCVDITDKDPHSPIGRNAFVTRKTATRVIASASIREVIEQFFANQKGSPEK
jgi:hypothetical protein